MAISQHTLHPQILVKSSFKESEVEEVSQLGCAGSGDKPQGQKKDPRSSGGRRQRRCARKRGRRGQLRPQTNRAASLSPTFPVHDKGNKCIILGLKR